MSAPIVGAVLGLLGGILSRLPSFSNASRAARLRARAVRNGSRASELFKEAEGIATQIRVLEGVEFPNVKEARRLRALHRKIEDKANHLHAKEVELAARAKELEK